MLKNISPLLSPDLLKALCEMGHGDEIVIADANFPGGTNSRVIRMDGVGGVEMLKAILSVIPLDTSADINSYLMALVPGDDIAPPIWDEYSSVLKTAEKENAKIGFIERFEYYARAGRAYAVIATGERSPYANLILKKGVIKV